MGIHIQKIISDLETASKETRSLMHKTQEVVKQMTLREDLAAINSALVLLRGLSKNNEAIKY